jgi:starvation-inducible DNA-binding protein
LSFLIEISKVVEDPEGLHKSDKEMITALVEAQKTLSATLDGASDIAAANGDKFTEDLCIERGRAHEKFAWLLQSHIS